MPGNYRQSCDMMFTRPGQHGHEADGTEMDDFYRWCYDEGAYTYETVMEEMVEEAALRAWTKTCTGLRTSPLCFLAPSCQRSAGGTKGLTHGDILPTHSRRHLS